MGAREGLHALNLVSDASACAAQGIVAFQMRVLPAGLSTTSRLVSAGPLTLWYHAPLAHLEAVLNGTAVRVPFAPASEWHSIAVAWEADRPCLLDPSSFVWRCATDADIADSMLLRPRSPPPDGGAAEIVIGGYQAHQPGLGLAADVDNVHLFAANTTIATAEVLQELLRVSAYEQLPISPPVDMCGVAIQDAPSLPWSTRAQAINATLVFKASFDNALGGAAVADVGAVNVTAQHIRFVLSGAFIDETIVLDAGVPQLYVLPVLASADVEAVVLRHTCMYQMQILEVAPTGAAGAPLAAGTLDAGRAVYLDSTQPGTCQLTISQGAAPSTTRTVSIRGGQPRWPPVAPLVGPLQLGLGAPGSVAFKLPGQHRRGARMVIAAEPKVGALSRAEVPAAGDQLRVGDALPFPNGGANRTVYWHRLAAPSDLQLEDTFAFFLEDPCGQSEVTTVPIVSPPVLPAPASLTVLGSAGLALCFDGSHTLQLAGLNLTADSCKPAGLPMIGSFGISLYFRTLQHDADPGGTLVAVGPFELALDRLSGIRFNVNGTRSRVHEPHTAWADGEWHRVVAMWDAAETRLSLRVDARRPVTTLLRWQDSNRVRSRAAAAVPGTVGAGFLGCMDELAIFTSCQDSLYGPSAAPGAWSAGDLQLSAGPISSDILLPDTCSGPLYLRFNDAAVNATNNWASGNSSATARLLADGESAFAPLQDVSTAFAPPSPPRLYVAAGQTATIHYEASRIGGGTPEVRMELLGPRDGPGGVIISLQTPGEPPRRIVSFDRVALPPGGSLVVSPADDDSGVFLLSLTPLPIRGGASGMIYSFNVQQEDAAITCSPPGEQRTLPSTSSRTISIPSPSCIRGDTSGALDMYIAALPGEGVLVLESGNQTVIERTPYSLPNAPHSLTFWKPTQPASAVVSIAFGAVDNDGVRMDALSLTIPLDDPAGSAPSAQHVLEFPQPGPAATFPALKQLLDGKTAALCRKHTQLPGVALQFRTTAALSEDMHVAETALYKLTLTRLSRLTVSMFDSTVISVPVHGANDGGWHAVEFAIADSAVQLSFDGSPVSTWDLTANQYNASLATALGSDAPVVLGNALMGATHSLFHGAMRDVHVTLRGEQMLRFPLTLESLAAGSARAVDSWRLGTGQSDADHVPLVTDEDTSIVIDLVRTPADPALGSIWVTELPRAGWIGEAPGASPFAPLLRPYVQLTGSTVVYEPLPDACSGVADYDEFEVIEAPAGQPVATAAGLQNRGLRRERVRVHVNCVDDAPRLLTSRVEARAPMNAAHRISLAGAVADVDGDAVWELTAPPAHGQLYAETDGGLQRLDARVTLPAGAAPQLVFQPILNTFGSPYTTFSFIVRDEHTVLPEVEVRVHVEDGLAMAQAAGGPLVTAPADEWGQVTLETWFRWASVPSEAETATCRLVLALGLGDLCLQPGAAVVVDGAKPPIVAGRWHRAAIAHGLGSTTVTIDGHTYATLQHGAGLPIAPTAGLDDASDGALTFGTISAYESSRFLSNPDRQPLHRLDFHTTSDAVTMDTVSGALFTVHSTNRSQLHAPLPRHASPPALTQQPPSATLADAAFPAGHALRFNGAMSVTLPAPLSAGAFRFEASFSTGQATGQTVALAHIGGALVLGWAKGVGLSVIAPSAEYSLPTSTSYNDGSWHRAEVTVQWLPAGNLEEPLAGHEGQLRVMLRVDGAATVGFVPYAPLNDTITLGAAPGFAGYANLVDDVTVSLRRPSAGRGRSPFVPALQLDLDEGTGDSTADAINGTSYAIRGTAASAPRNAHWVPSTALRPSSALELAPNSTTTIMLGVDADGDNITAVISSADGLPDSEHAALLLPRCVSPLVDSCRVREHHLPLHLPQAAATLAVNGRFVTARAPTRLLTYTLTDGMMETGPHRLVARPALQDNQPPIVGSHARVEAVSAFSPRDVPSHVLHLSDLAVDPEGGAVTYYVSHATGAWLHAYDASSPSRTGRPLQSDGGRWAQPTVLYVAGRRMLAWSAGAAEAVTLVPAAASAVVHVHVIACDEDLACSEVTLPVALRRVRRSPCLSVQRSPSLGSSCGAKHR